MKWQIRPELPIYTQLFDQFSMALASGEFPPGTRLPSVRVLAQEAGVNPNTMQRALHELERAGLVESRRTAGRVVTLDTGSIEQLRRRLAEEQAAGFLSAMAALGYDRVQTVVLLERLREENRDT